MEEVEPEQEGVEEVEEVVRLVEKLEEKLEEEWLWEKVWEVELVLVYHLELQEVQEVEVQVQEAELGHEVLEEYHHHHPPHPVHHQSEGKEVVELLEQPQTASATQGNASHQTLLFQR